MDNYMMYNGTDGIYTHTVQYERDAACPVCSAGTAVPVTASMTLQQVRHALLALRLPSRSASDMSCNDTQQRRLWLHNTQQGWCQTGDQWWSKLHCTGVQCMTSARQCILPASPQLYSVYAVASTTPMNCLVMQLLDHLLQGELGELTAPSISAQGDILYMRGPLEATYKKNLSKPLFELLASPPDEEECVMVNVTDPILPNPVRVRLVAGDVEMSDA
jgi:hypothetical protein